MTREHFAHRDPSNRYFQRQCRRKHVLIFRTYAGEIRDIITRILTYDLRLQHRETLLPKHDILCCYKPDAEAIVQQVVEVDPDVLEEEDQRAILQPCDRLQIPVALLQEYWAHKTPVRITLRNGWMFTGMIAEYGVFSIRLAIQQGAARVMLLKANIYDLEKDKQP